MITSSYSELPVEGNSNTGNNIRVCFRIRPLIPIEIAAGEVESITALPDKQTVRLIPKQTTYNNKVDIQQYRLDRCFGPSVSQEEFFHDSGVKSLCDAAISGQAATVFCYGQTGGGKTYTMCGPQVSDTVDEEVRSSNNDMDGGAYTAIQEMAADMGLQYRSVEYIAQTVTEINRQILEDTSKENEEPSTSDFTPITIKASYLEIYNEQVNDLLNQTHNLKIHWSQGAQSFYVENLMIVRCDDNTDLLEVLREGSCNRKRGSHKLNTDSSRSHVIFTLYFERRESATAPVKYGKINFADLAGSEKLKDSENVGINAEETKSINTSLFTLGKVISALSKKATLKHQRMNNYNIHSNNNEEDVFVPYRESALTKLLMDTLGGNCATLMVACVSPAQRFIGESMRTIKYAIRAKNIVNCVVSVRMDPTQRQVYELKTEVEMLKKENLRLRKVIVEGIVHDTSNSCVRRDDMNVQHTEDSDPGSIETRTSVSTDITDSNHHINKSPQAPLHEEIKMDSIDKGEAVVRVEKEREVEIKKENLTLPAIPVSYRKRQVRNSEQHTLLCGVYDGMPAVGDTSSGGAISLHSTVGHELCRLDSSGIVPPPDVRWEKDVCPMLSLFTPSGTDICNDEGSHSQPKHSTRSMTDTSSISTLLESPSCSLETGGHTDQCRPSSNIAKGSDVCGSERGDRDVPLASCPSEVAMQPPVASQLTGFGFKSAQRRRIGLLL